MSEPPRIVWKGPPAGDRQPPEREPPPRMRFTQPRPPTPLLDAIGRDLTALARAGAFDDLIPRDAIALRLMRALLRREKANPVLIGEPGVGKTAIVEELARRVARGDIAGLENVRIIEAPIGDLVAGTVFRGQLEQRVLDLLAEARNRPDLILFLDEFHLVVGGGSAEGSIDIGNLIKPALARGEIRCIGATTPAEFARAMRRDPALERRLAPVRVDEPSEAEALALLTRAADGFIRHHGVDLDPAALAAAVQLSAHYLPDRRLPDKAFDLLDDACTVALLPGLNEHPAARPLVTAEMVARALSDRTGLPLAHLIERERVGTNEIAAHLEARVVGQEAAVAAAAEAIRLARLGLREPERPRAVLLFGGPSGVGKTALARAMAETLTGSEATLLRIDLSEYQEQYAISRLLGAPPGYIGHDMEGQFARHLRVHPAAVVLLDEIEKAHPRVLDLFLQVFDAGRLTDGHGRVVDARHAWFVLTTNVPIEADRAALREHLRPEFLNRIDRIVAFMPLGLEALLTIARGEIERLAGPLAAHGFTLVAEPTALLHLCRPEADEVPANGRTVLRRAEQEIAAPLAALLEEAGATGPLTVTIRKRGDGLRFNVPGASGAPAAPDE
ncbi:MAG: ATP-dependent Clp protease ATP-binding subunit [Thermomicrobiales bacterium]|nr:ATP-dependent Clp protease ATP-binding subunit [Thermomicrobiales bacterium]